MLFCIMICKIQMTVLRVYMPTLHLALGRPIEDLGHKHKIMFDYPASKQKKPEIRSPVIFFPRELLERPTHTQSQEQGPKIKIETSKKMDWNENRQKSVWVDFWSLSAIPTLLLALKRWAHQFDHLNCSSSTLDNVFFFRWLQAFWLSCAEDHSLANYDSQAKSGLPSSV